jgi:plasmid stabilization system protein ParE
VRIELTTRAEQLAEAASLWWHENRQAAPTLFDRELLEALELLTEMPNIGVPYPPRPTYRRLLLRRTGYHVYYRVDDAADVLYVVSIWHTRRGRGPRF